MLSLLLYRFLFPFRFLFRFRFLFLFLFPFLFRIPDSRFSRRPMQSDMQRIIDTFGCRSNRSSYFFQSSNWYVLSLTSWFCILEMFISIYRNICTILNARTLTAPRRKLDITKESSCTYVTNKFHSGKLLLLATSRLLPKIISDTFDKCLYS